MASTLVALAQYPDQRRLLVEDRSLIPQAIEEVLRWMPVVEALPARHACSEESEVGGVRGATVGTAKCVGRGAEC